MPEPLARGGDEFILRVKGDSMVDAGILDGDYVVVRRQQDAQNGDVVVALAGDDEAADEATVKRFFRESGRVRLQPENDALEPIYAAARADARQGDRRLPEAVMSVVAAQRSLDQELLALAPRRQPGVPRLRRVRAAAAGRLDLLPGVRLLLARGPAESVARDRATIRMQAG